MGQYRLFFSFFSNSNSNAKYTYNLNYVNWKKRRCCAWVSNPGRRIIGADDSTELWWTPTYFNLNQSTRSFVTLIPSCGCHEQQITSLYHRLSIESIQDLRQCHDRFYIFKSAIIPGLFFVYFRLFKQTIQFLLQICVKNVHQVYGAGIWAFRTWVSSL